MRFLSLRLTQENIFSFLFISSLTTALFYTGLNTWLFSTCYIFLVLCMAIVLKQRFHKSIDVAINGIFISSGLLLLWFGISIFPSQIKYLSIYNFFWLGSFIIVFFIYTLNHSREYIWHTTWPAVLILVCFWACYGLIQYFYLHEPINASFLNRNSLAALINLALIPTSGYFLLKEKERPWKNLTTLSLVFY